MLGYEASRAALLQPGLRPTVFSVGARLPINALCSECSRLAYLRFESDAGQREQLGAAVEADRSVARLAFMRGPAWVSGNVFLRELADHAPINYVRAFF